MAHGGAGGERAPGEQVDFSVGTNTTADEIARVQLTGLAQEMD